MDVWSTAYPCVCPNDIMGSVVQRLCLAHDLHFEWQDGEQSLERQTDRQHRCMHAFEITYYFASTFVVAVDGRQIPYNVMPCVGSATRTNQPSHNPLKHIFGQTTLHYELVTTSSSFPKYLLQTYYTMWAGNALYPISHTEKSQHKIDSQCFLHTESWCWCWIFSWCFCCWGARTLYLCLLRVNT